MTNSIGIKKPKAIEVQGIILPAEWDHDGRITELKLCAAGEISYIVRDDKKGRRLKKFLRQSVKVWGDLEVQKSGERHIFVKRITSDYLWDTENSSHRRFS